MIIDWKKYVDHIYIVDYTLSDPYYTNWFYKELERVGINKNDPSFVTDFMNIKSPLFEKIYESFINKKEKMDYTVPCSLGHYYCMKHAQQMNYNYILILENDAIFYDNLEIIDYILSNAKYCLDNDICDLFLGGAGCLGLNSSKINYNDNMIYKSNGLIAGTTFNIYKPEAYTKYINLIENGIYYVVDWYDKIYDMDRVAISNIYICVQKLWDLLAENLYEHYNMPKPKIEHMLRCYNNDCKKHSWPDRNSYKILANAIEYHNMIDELKEIYEDCKKHS